MTISLNRFDDLEDTDLLACTDADGVTYKVTGAQFMALFEEKEKSYETDPNIDVVPGEKTYTLRVPLDSNNKIKSTVTQYNHGALKFVGFEDDSYTYLPLWRGSKVRGTAPDDLSFNATRNGGKYAYVGMAVHNTNGSFNQCGWVYKGDWVSEESQPWKPLDSETLVKAKPTWYAHIMEAASWMFVNTEITMREPVFLKIKNENFRFTQEGPIDGDPIAGTDWADMTDGQLLVWYKDEICKFFLIDNQTSVNLKVTPVDYKHYSGAMTGDYEFVELSSAQAELMRSPYVSIHEDWSYSADEKA